MKHLAKDSTTPAENAPEKERTVARHARPADTSADDAPASAPTFSPSDTTPFLGAAAREREQRASGKPPRKPNFITRTVNGWWNRLLGAVSEGSLASQEAEYAAHRTSRDYVWNTIGFAAWGMEMCIRDRKRPCRTRLGRPQSLCENLPRSAASA